MIQSIVSFDMFRPLLSILIVFFGFTVSSQNQPNEVNLIKPDLLQIELLTFDRVNDLREKMDLADLIWDDLLYRAAKDHAQYLIGEEKISHFQTIAGKKTPYERVKVHGGHIFTAVGENVISITLGVEFPHKGRKRSTVTYSSAAQTMADSWKQSPGHYKNIISEKYNTTALAVSYDGRSQRLIAVQVFAYSPAPGASTQPDFSEYLLKLPTPTLPFRLKGYRFEKKKQKAIRGFAKLEMDRGHITGSFKKAKKIFKGRRSGIAQEFIPLSQYDSASSDFSRVPNRRNGLYELNGELEEPVYRRELLRYSRKNTERDYYSFVIFKRKVELPIKKPTTIFRYPLHNNGYGWEFNLFFIKDRKLSINRSYIMVPGEMFDHPFPEINFINSFQPLPDHEEFNLTHQYDTVQFQLFYASGDIGIPKKSRQEVEEMISAIPGKIISIKAEAYASIEGGKSSNDQLAKDRLDHFISLVRPMLDSVFVPTKLRSNEQWKLFANQIEGTNLASLKHKNKDEVRDYVNQNIADSVLSRMLDAQRYTMMKLVFRQDFKVYDPVKSIEYIYDSLKVEFSKFEKPNNSVVNALEKAQCALYYRLSLTDSASRALPEVPQSDRFPVFQYHDLVYRYTIVKDIDKVGFYNGLQRLGSLKYFPTQLRNQLIYNNQILIYKNFFLDSEATNLLNPKKLWCFRYRNSAFNLNKYRKIKCEEDTLTSPEILYYILKQIPGMITLSERVGNNELPIEELWKFYYLYTILSLFNEIPLNPEISKLLPGFKRHFHPNDAELTEEERLKLGYFYADLHKYNTARNLIEPIATSAEPNQQALKLYTTLIYDDFDTEHELSEYLISQFDRLGKEEWCDLWYNPKYLNFLLFEDLKLKNFYNCKCK